MAQILQIHGMSHRRFHLPYETECALHGTRARFPSVERQRQVDSVSGTRRDTSTISFTYRLCCSCMPVFWQGCLTCLLHAMQFNTKQAQHLFCRQGFLPHAPFTLLCWLPACRLVVIWQTSAAAHGHRVFMCKLTEPAYLVCVCSICGVQSFYVPRSHPHCKAVTVHCLDPGTVGKVEIETFDGINWEQSHAHYTARQADARDAG